MYLRDRGLAENQESEVSGRNAGTYGPAAPRIQGAHAADAKPTTVGQGTMTVK